MGPGRHRSASATRSGGSLRIFWIRVSSAMTSLGGIVGPGDVWPCAGTRSAGRTGFRVSGSVHAARRSRSIWSSQAAIWFQLAGIRDANQMDGPFSIASRSRRSMSRAIFGSARRSAFHSAANHLHSSRQRPGDGPGSVRLVPRNTRSGDFECTHLPTGLSVPGSGVTRWAPLDGNRPEELGRQRLLSELGREESFREGRVVLRLAGRSKPDADAAAPAARSYDYLIESYRRCDL
jgi:hypothetical protein